MLTNIVKQTIMFMQKLLTVIGLGCFMDKQNVKIISHLEFDENGVNIPIYGLEIKRGDAVFVFPDLVTDKDRLIRFCRLIENDIPDEKILLELFEDFLF